MHIVDRRLNPGGKNLSNRQRFIKRARALVRQAVREASSGRSIKDIGQSGEISIPADGVREPTLRRGAEGGERDYLLPGNKGYVRGDRIRRPQGGQGRGGEPSDDGEGEDEFRFALSADEFLELFLEDLELPDLAKRQVTGEAAVEWRRAGFSTSGSPSAISVPRTLRNSLSRRMALRRPRPQELLDLEAEIAALEASGAGASALAPLRERLEVLRLRMKRIPFLDQLDLRYRRLESIPKPIARAVMFCLMDVSGSMDEHLKDLAKRFYTLLYLFLRRRYLHVEVVFIRHTHVAEEVDEETFFHSRETGGTVVSTALELMAKVATERFPADSWNVYAAQASDGDNISIDNPKAARLLTEVILPQCQYFAYVEVGAEGEANHGGSGSSLWRTYALLQAPDLPMAMRRVRHRREIYPVFRDLFTRAGAERAG